MSNGKWIFDGWVVFVTCNGEVVQGDPSFQVFQRSNIRIDMQLRQCVRLTSELYVSHQLQLILVDVSIDDLVVRLAGLVASDLGNQSEQSKYLHLVEYLANRSIAGRR